MAGFMRFQWLNNRKKQQFNYKKELLLLNILYIYVSSMNFILIHKFQSNFDPDHEYKWHSSCH